MLNLEKTYSINFWWKYFFYFGQVKTFKLFTSSIVAEFHRDFWLLHFSALFIFPNFFFFVLAVLFLLPNSEEHHSQLKIKIRKYFSYWREQKSLQKDWTNIMAKSIWKVWRNKWERNSTIHFTVTCCWNVHSLYIQGQSYQQLKILSLALKILSHHRLQRAFTRKFNFHFTSW